MCLRLKFGIKTLYPRADFFVRFLLISHVLGSTEDRQHCTNASMWIHRFEIFCIKREEWLLSGKFLVSLEKPSWGTDCPMFAFHMYFLHFPDKQCMEAPLGLNIPYLCGIWVSIVSTAVICSWNLEKSLLNLENEASLLLYKSLVKCFSSQQLNLSCLR